MKRKAVEVETLIRTDVDTQWERTQDPLSHHLWDIRFSSVTPLSAPGEDGAPRFAYVTRLPFGITLRSEGTIVGRRDGWYGSRTTSLTLRSDDPKMLITQATGYWKYEPVDGGVRFRSHFQYETRYGLAGRLVDAALLRPYLRWATAWSFDRMRLWIEKGIEPGSARRASLAHLLARGTVAFLWIYHGLVPKLLYPESGELRLLREYGMFPGYEGSVIQVVGVLEIVLGLLILFFWRSRRLVLASIVPAAVLTAGGIATDPGILKGPFNAVSLTVPIVVLAVVASLLDRDLPSGRSRRVSTDG